MTTETTNAPVSLADVLRARRVLLRYLPASPLVEAPVLSEQLDCRVFLKLDSMLPTGAFKVRGGIYLLSQMSERERARGIVAATRGNHGQSLAYACRLFGAPCYVFVPRGNSPIKNAAMRRLGATLSETGRDFDEACDAAAAFATKTGALFVHPGNDARLFAGIGTWAVEALEQAPVDIDAVFVPVGAGSCLAGAIPVFEGMSPRTAVIGVSAAAAPAFAHSLAAGEVREMPVDDTVADGLAVRRPPDLAFKCVINAGASVSLASEREIKNAMRDLLVYEGVIAEGASAATLAAARNQRVAGHGGAIILAITGRNVDEACLHEVAVHKNQAGRTFVRT